MNTSGFKPSRGLGLLNEAFFSLNLSGLVLGIVLTRRSELLMRWDLLVFNNRYGRWLRVGGPTENAEFGGILAWLVLAAAMFIATGLLSRLSLAERLLRTAAGPIAIAGLHLSCLYPFRCYTSPTAVLWVPPEVLVVVVLAFRLLRWRRTRLRLLFFLPVLAVHFGILVWATGPQFTPGPGVFLKDSAGWFWHFYQAAPVLGPLLSFLSALVWGLLKCERLSAEPGEHH
jgi:hypothetical protein